MHVTISKAHGMPYHIRPSHELLPYWLSPGRLSTYMRSMLFMQLWCFDTKLHCTESPDTQPQQQNICSGHQCILLQHVLPLGHMSPLQATGGPLHQTLPLADTLSLSFPAAAVPVTAAKSLLASAMRCLR